MTNDNKFTPQLTADGSFTFFSTEFGETFHSQHGASQESFLKFVEPCQLAQKALQPALCLLDICYGLGYNTAAALATIWAVNPKCRVECIGLELDPTVPQAAIAHNLLGIIEPDYTQILTQLATTGEVRTELLQAQLLIGDARATIKKVNWDFQADAIFLDPFSPPKCPQLWTVEFLKLVAGCLKLTGKIATYSCAAAMRTSLIAAGLHISSTPSASLGKRSPGTVAAFTPVVPPLSAREQEHLHTKAAIPYRDPSLCDTAATILHRRQIEQQSTTLEPTSHWKKRWINCPR